MTGEPKTRIEVIDGREFKVTVLPDQVPPPNRSKRTTLRTESQARLRAEKKAKAKEKKVDDL
jgi:hypothetical protein